MTERVIKREEREYKKLQVVAKLLEIESPNGRRYTVEDVYLDAGQDWMWTTIISHGGFMEYQVLNPREWKEIMAAETAKEIAECVDRIRNGEYFSDKVKE